MAAEQARVVAAQGRTSVQVKALVLATASAAWSVLELALTHVQPGDSLRVASCAVGAVLQRVAVP